MANYGGSIREYGRFACADGVATWIDIYPPNKYLWDTRNKYYMDLQVRQNEMVCMTIVLFPCICQPPLTIICWNYQVSRVCSVTSIWWLKRRFACFKGLVDDGVRWNRLECDGVALIKFWWAPQPSVRLHTLWIPKKMLQQAFDGYRRKDV
jgi:hypothetical protein